MIPKTTHSIPEDPKHMEEKSHLAFLSCDNRIKFLMDYLHGVGSI
jgi:hypothetical protein